MATEGALGKVYQDGEIITREGDVGRHLYVIQEGWAEVVVDRGGKRVVLRELGAGEIVGEMAIFDRVVRSATVRAKGQSRVLTLDKKNFLCRVSEDPSIAFRIVETMSRRIRSLSQEVVELRGKLDAIDRQLP